AQKIDLPLGKKPHFGPINRYSADHSPLLEHWDGQIGANTTKRHHRHAVRASAEHRRGIAEVGVLDRLTGGEHSGESAARRRYERSSTKDPFCELFTRAPMRN